MSGFLFWIYAKITTKGAGVTISNGQFSVVRHEAILHVQIASDSLVICKLCFSNNIKRNSSESLQIVDSTNPEIFKFALSNTKKL